MIYQQKALSYHPVKLLLGTIAGVLACVDGQADFTPREGGLLEPHEERMEI